MRKAEDSIRRYIYENFWIVASFAFAQPIVAKIFKQRFHGEWDDLSKSIYDAPELRADRALLEMAVQVRVLLDEDEASPVQAGGPVGKLVLRNGKSNELSIRQMANKVIHGERFEWVLTTSDDPKIIVHSAAGSEDWSKAEVDLIAVMVHIGQLTL